jgi:hypothetical protein
VLELVKFDGGLGELGVWGRITIDGIKSATIRSSTGVDTNLPAGIAEGLVRDLVMCDSESGEILILPYEGDLVAAVNPDTGELRQLARLTRDADVGMRIAGVRFPPLGGVLFICEGAIILFDVGFRIQWRLDGDFSSWSLAGVDDKQFWLVASDYLGEERRQRRSLADGSVCGPA